MKFLSELSHRQRILLTGVLAAIGVFCVAVVGAGASLDWYFAQRIFPGVRYGVNDLGGLSRQDASVVLSQWRDQWWSKQMEYVAKDEGGKTLATVQLYPVVVADGNGQSYDLVWYDFEPMLDQAFAYGRSENVVFRIANIIRAMAVADAPLQPIVQINREKLSDFLRSRLADFETHPQDAALVNRSSFARPMVVAELPGNTFDYDLAMADTEVMLLQLRQEPINLLRRHRNPTVTAADAAIALDSYDTFVSQFPLTLMYDDPAAGIVRRWDIRWADVFRGLALSVPAQGEPRLILKDDGLEAFWRPMESAINIEPQDAKFEINEDKRVEMFQPSRIGASVDQGQTLAAINAWLVERLSSAESNEQAEKLPVSLVVNVVEPQVTTANVIDLGITEVLGVGYSNYSGSPKNRVHNIGIGVKLLNGLLIPPAEEFSLLNALKPFTIGAGYLPELVIKGDKIEPEVGGGLCQIGSTTFRAAMNSGLPITERRNHSLVVSYYNDPRNGNPGTDATIYDPAPDLKFLNDTGNYILITTSMNYDNGDLVFTFWGTNDGRKAEYSNPLVSRWIPAGAEKLIETTDLEPGKKKCQSSHVGAVASFTYTITRPDGKIEEQLFTSSYRPLPRICLVGVDPAAAPTTPAGPENGANVAPDGAPIQFDA